MRTIFIIISRGIIARNILRGGVLENLLKDENIRIVLLLPNAAPEYFRKEFAHPRIILENTSEGSLSKAHHAFLYFLHNLVYTKDTCLLSRYGTYRTGGKNLLLYSLEFITFAILSRLNFLKKLFRILELYLFSEKKYESFFDKYKPNLVFATTILGKVDIAFLKIAKKRKIKNIATTKGWDSVDQRLFRARPDKLIVFNRIMKNIVSELQDIPEQDIFISGFPQFDIYNRKELIVPRQEFFRKIGLNPENKLIFFGSEGLWGVDEDEIIQLLCDFIKNNEFSSPASLIIRPHYSDVGKRRFEKFKSYPFVYLDDKHRLSNLFLDHWDAAREEMIDFFHTLYYSDVIISTRSTLTLEGAMLDKPLINLYFDTRKGKTYKESIKHPYDYAFYRPVINSGASIFPRSPEELKDAINNYFAQPALNQEGRKLLLNELCYKNDGKSAERITRFITKNLYD